MRAHNLYRTAQIVCLGSATILVVASGTIRAAAAGSRY